MFSAIKSFAKRNRVLFILLIVAVSITLSYYISYDIPELISGIEKWYKLFSDLSIGVIINFIFYVSEYKVQYIRPLTLAEIAFFEARMSLAKQAKGGIPHIYMKGCN